MTPRFLIAKYVADLNRMEPRNIGVVLWSKGEIVARFLEPELAHFITEKSLYQQITASWKELIQQAAIKPLRGKPVPKKQPESLDALLSHQEDRFLLVDAGELLDAVPKRELQSAVNFLYSDLVTEKTAAKEVARVEFKSRVKQLFSQTGLQNRPGFQERFPVECAVFGTKRPLHFSYGIGNGHPELLFQRVKIANDPDVHNAALMIHSSTENAIIEQRRCAAIFDSSTEGDEEPVLDRINRNVGWLEKLCVPIDLANFESACQKLSAVAGG